MQLADVLLEVKVPAEALATRGAGEGLLVVVSVHVEGEVVNLVEGLVADIALELLLPAVGQLVVFVIPCNTDDRATGRTWEKSSRREEPRVGRQGGAAAGAAPGLAAGLSRGRSSAL